MTFDVDAYLLGCLSGSLMTVMLLRIRLGQTRPPARRRPKRGLRRDGR